MSTFGTEMLALMAERGLSLRKLAKIVHLSDGYLSRISRDQRVPSVAAARVLDEVLCADGKLIDLARAADDGSGRPSDLDEAEGADQRNSGAGDGSEGVSSRLDLLSLAWTFGKLDQSMDRRSVLQLAAAVTAAPALGMADPIERISRALTRPTGIGEEIVTQMEARCIGFHRLEFVMPAEQLFCALIAHLNEITTLLEAAPADRWRKRLARVAGESAVLGAWLAWDLGGTTRCAALYRIAELAAAESGDPAIRACSVIYQSFAIGETVGHHAAFRTLERARTLLPERGDPATRAWLMGRTAEEAAALGDPSARELIEEASDLMADARPQVERSWTRCLESPRMAHMRLAIATRLGDERAVHDEIGELVILAGDQAQKKTGRILATIGLALTRIGDLQEGMDFGERAVEAVRVSHASYAMNRLTELGSALKTDPSVRSRELRAAIGATRRVLASPRPSTPGTTPIPS